VFAKSCAILMSCVENLELCTVCFFCKNLVSDIQGILENHKPDCKYRLKKEAEQQ